MRVSPVVFQVDNTEGKLINNHALLKHGMGISQYLWGSKTPSLARTLCREKD